MACKFTASGNLRSWYIAISAWSITLDCVQSACTVTVTAIVLCVQRQIQNGGVVDHHSYTGQVIAERI